MINLTIQSTIQNTIQSTIRNTLGSETEFSILDLFKSGQQGAWYDPSDLTTLYQDSNGTTPVTLDGQPVGLVTDKSGNVNNASQPVAAARPTYNDTPDRLTLDKVDDAIIIDIPAGGWTGSMVLGTVDGTASYGVTIPAGEYTLGGRYFPSNTINNLLLRDGAVSASDLAKVEADFVKDGATASYGDVTDFSNYWRDNNLTSFPLIDTSSGTNFYLAWYKNSLTSFPLIDTSSGTNFSNAWRDNSLTSFPLIDTSSGTNFYLAWYKNSLTSFPLIDTSSGTNFSNAWRDNSLTSFPLIDTSSGTNFREAWRGNTTLSTFPANMFDNCLAINFTNTFLNTGLSQSSIDGILVSINSNNTSNGVFGQSGGSAPSATGEAAITAMRSRGWTITVTGGF